MKKILLPLFMLGVSFVAIHANAAEIEGKVVAKKGDEIHVQPQTDSKPTSLKITPQTKYFEKEEKKSSPSQEVNVDEFVEVIYSIDPKTNEPIIDEIVVVDFID